MAAQLSFAAAVIWLFFMFSLPVRPAWSEEESKEAPQDLDLIINQALEQNPDLKAADTRQHFFADKIVQASSLEDPRLTLALANYPTDSYSWNQSPMTGQIVKLSQNLPFPGKLAAKANIAEQQANWYREAYRETKIQLIRQVKESWYNLYLQERTLERTEASLALLDDIILMAENLYETGKGSQQDILKAQVERSILFEKRLNLRQQRDIALANLNSLRNTSTETAINTPQDLAPRLYPYSLEELQEKAATQRPLASAYQSLADQYKAQAELARLNYYPDFSVGAAYTFRQPNPADSGTDFASLEFSVNLPLFQEKRREFSAESEAGAAMARHQLDDFLNKTRLSIHDSYTLMEKNSELMSLYKAGIIPQATQSFAASVSGYQVGRIAFAALLDNLLTLYKYEVEYYRTQVDHARSIARLEAEAGLTADQADKN